MLLSTRAPYSWHPKFSTSQALRRELLIRVATFVVDHQVNLLVLSQPRDDIDEVNKHIVKAAIRLLQRRNTAPFDRVTEVSVGVFASIDASSIHTR